VNKNAVYKTIGIIGGMGPAATVDLMAKIIGMTEADGDQDHIPVVVDSNTRIPDRTAAILHDGEDPRPELLKSAKRLESIGADFLIMACNTVHYYIEDIRNEVTIPVMDMIGETADLLVRRGIRKAAVLATDGTCRSGIYESVLSDRGIETLYPEPAQQKLVMSLVYDYIKKNIISAEELPRDEIVSITDDLRSRGAEVLILACTELPIAFAAMGIETDCIDPTQVLAAAAVIKAGGTLKEDLGWFDGSYHY